MTLAHLLDPKVFATLTPQDVDRLEAIIDSEIVRNPEILKILKDRVDKFLPHLKR